MLNYGHTYKEYTHDHRVLHGLGNHLAQSTTGGGQLGSCKA
jgi:hypothetical protein